MIGFSKRLGYGLLNPARPDCLRMLSSPEWLIWQLADSAFPGGGFAHSQGLEATWQLGEIDGEAGLIDFLQAGLRQSARGSLPFVLAALDGIDLTEVDHACDLFLSSEVANRASRATGRGYLAACGRSLELPPVALIVNRIKEYKLPGHWPTIFGAIARALALGRLETARLFLFVSLRGMISAAVRLGIIGPIRGQAIQFQTYALAESLADRAHDWTMDDAAQVAPLIELSQGAHDRLYSKLFLS